MGYEAVDSFSLLHIGVGAVMYSAGLTLSQAMVVHIIYEIVDNQILLGRCIRDFKMADCKFEPDTRINTVMDQLSALIGFEAAAKAGLPALPTVALVFTAAYSGTGSAFVYNLLGNEAYKANNFACGAFLTAYYYAFLSNF